MCDEILVGKARSTIYLAGVELMFSIEEVDRLLILSLNFLA